MSCFRVKKLLKQVDRLQLQLTEARAHSRDLKAQLADAADYKVTDILFVVCFLQALLFNGCVTSE
jgi:predicted component of type VI protein secretion system